MAKGPKNSQPAQVVTELGEEFQDLYTAADLSPALAKLQSEAGIEGEVQVTVYIYKMREGLKDARVWEGPPADYDLMSIARQHGSGDYRMRIYMPTERGNPGQRATWIEPVMLSPAEDARLEQLRRGETPGTAIAQPAQPADVVAQIVAAIKAATPAPAPQPDPLAAMERMASIFKAMMPAPTAPAGGMSETLGLLKTAMDLTNSMRGGNEDGDGRSVKDVGLLKGLSLVEKMFERSLSDKPPVTAANQANGATAAQAVLTIEQTAEIEEMNLMLTYLLRKVKSDTTADDIAAEIYEDVPDAMFAELYGNPQWFETLCHNAPGFTPYKEKCEAMRAKLIAFAQEDGVLTVDGKLVQSPAHGASDAGHAGGDTATPGKQ